MFDVTTISTECQTDPGVECKLARILKPFLLGRRIQFVVQNTRLDLMRSEPHGHGFFIITNSDTRDVDIVLSSREV